MSGDGGNVRLAVTGSIAIAPVGTPGPKDARTPLPAQWLSLGFISEDGIAEVVTENPTEIVPWRSSRAARVTPGVVSVRYRFAMLESNAEALSLFYGDTVAPGASWHHVARDNGGSDHSVVLTIIDGDHVTRRWLPRAEVVERGERVLSAVDPGGMSVTLVAYPSGDLMGDGVSAQAVVMYSEPILSGGLPAAPPQPPVEAEGDFSLSFGTAFG